MAAKKKAIKGRKTPSDALLELLAKPPSWVQRMFDRQDALEGVLREHELCVFERHAEIAKRIAALEAQRRVDHTDHGLMLKDCITAVSKMADEIAHQNIALEELRDVHLKIEREGASVHALALGSKVEELASHVRQMTERMMTPQEIPVVNLPGVYANPDMTSTQCVTPGQVSRAFTPKP